MSENISQADALLPPGWQRAPLAQVAQINPILDRRIADDTVAVNFVPMRAVEPEGGGLIRPEVRPYGEVKKGYTAFLTGDVIMAKITPCMENGKAAVVPELPGSVCFGSTEFHVLRPENGVESRWFLNFLLQHEIRRAAQRQMAGGVGQMRVPATFFDIVEIPLPATAEQQRITDAIDELFSDLDAGVAALERVKEKLKLHRASVLKAAVEGALTAEWRAHHPQTEPASELLKRILAERCRRWEEEQRRKFKEKGQEPPKNWNAKYKEPKTPDVVHLAEIPSSWTWTGFEQLADGTTHAFKAGPFGSALKKEYYSSSGYKIYGQEQVIRDDAYFGDYFIDQQRFDMLRSCAIKPGDVLISLVGTAGKVLVLPPDAQLGIINPRLLKISLSPNNIVPRYVKLVLESPWARHFFKAQAHGGTMEILNLGILKLFPIPLPSLEEQQAIVDEVEDLLSVIDHLEAELESKLKKAQALRQSILCHAFAGQLVPQNPNDEPASELLKRIAAERMARARESTYDKRVNKKSSGPGGSRRGRPRNNAKGND